MGEGEVLAIIPPAFQGDGSRSGQSVSGSLPAVSDGVPTQSVIGALPEILIQGGRESQHSQLTWNLISKSFSVAEDNLATLRAERDAARNESERWRTSATKLSEELVGLKARWESVNTLTNAQAMLYVVGGVLLGPLCQDTLNRRFDPTTMSVGLLGAASVVVGFWLGRIGPRRSA